jgi:aryl-alcohol dehydrogenase-like predicted oxidoreductase
MVPIPGTTKVTRLEENIAAASVELSAGEVGEINEGLSTVTVQGNRYPDNLERLMGR